MQLNDLTEPTKSTRRMSDSFSTQHAESSDKQLVRRLPIPIRIPSIRNLTQKGSSNAVFAYPSYSTANFTVVTAHLSVLFS